RKPFKSCKSWFKLYICAMVYRVIGLMSGSSLDGLDIVFAQLDEIRGKWSYEIKCADCVPYSEDWARDLADAKEKSVPDFLKLNTAYGRYLGEQVNQFIGRNNLHHQVHFIASHGHTVFHEPHNGASTQIGDGASIAAVTGLPVISDLRSLDVALGGQGAPIVPIGDKLLFGEYDYWLNIGGIANITVLKNDKPVAFDICPANQILNGLAEREGKTMDENGDMARAGEILVGAFTKLNDAAYYAQPAPKSLSNELARDMAFPVLLESEHSNADMLHTMVLHIAGQVAKAAFEYPSAKPEPKLLVTGGGAFNKFLVEKIQDALMPQHISVEVPDATVVQYKEALVMALIGALRWREETNVMSSVTGAGRDSIGGALWMGHSYNGE
ncbi:MAG TPA: anhydro-N-acetylmuramic acid kinase, partial [Flavipsychrobacter sp.]|nr:anhydro-N-acetylmuramic acid kinase [Flavipsychrobacter sp.]